MRVAVFGGSFNPPHVGHAMVAAWLRWADRVDEVWLLPAFRHAFDKSLAPFDVRVRACEALSTVLGVGFRVETIESTLPTPSYTVRTLDALAARHPEHRFRFVVGADVLPQLPQWREWARVAEQYAPIVVGRGAVAVDGAPTFPEVSSTEVRRRIAAGEPVDHLVPAAVLAAVGDAWR